MSTVRKLFKLCIASDAMALFKRTPLKFLSVFPERLIPSYTIQLVHIFR